MQMEDHASPLGRLYQQVKAAMLSVDSTKGSQAAVDQLVKVADEW